MREKLKELEEKAKAGDYTAAMNLAEALKWGYYGEASPSRAMALYRACTAAPSRALAASAWYNLGVFYYYGLLDEKTDVRLAFDCFMKSALLLPGKEALSRLADMYRYGQYVEQNDSVALHLYLKAASA
ncbi:MAG: SEL1-like repeat protein [Clostridia bacterium]|nr:SEL1-like repeat protein [Clostridia bacterium]